MSSKRASGAEPAFDWPRPRKSMARACWSLVTSAVAKAFQLPLSNTAPGARTTAGRLRSPARAAETVRPSAVGKVTASGAAMARPPAGTAQTRTTASARERTEPGSGLAFARDEERRQRPHLVAGTGDARRAALGHLVDAHDRVHGDEGAVDVGELAPQLVLRRIDHHLRPLAEQEPLDLDEAEQVALPDGAGVDLIHLAVIQEDDLVHGLLGKGSGLSPSHLGWIPP